MHRALLVAAAILLAGCAGTPEEPQGPQEVEVGPPPIHAGGFADCAPQGAVLTSLETRASSTQDARGLGPGLHRLDNNTLLYVWASYQDTLREDRVSRVNEVQAWRAPDGALAVCTRVEIAAPTTVPESDARTYDVALVIEAPQGFPPTRLDVVVNWVAGCRCDPTPRGNATATFDAPTIVPQTA